MNLKSGCTPSVSAIVTGKDTGLLCFSNPGREYAGLQIQHSPLHIYVLIGMSLSAKVISRCKNQCFTSA